ncbi:alpha/beta hydrolase family protein [Alicyclobacillus acidocaldarius]|uniref:Peptidase S15 n=1 Tax=Alicyclobacillus acidocaldarius subsp. acidocaldarius (strain ATCC 27009 / DSM 446 / BCRC 14685 / JCM 5260 / KCTC 1825 / NBRC 15652 / NCIMB 11725 / NRRL B-14509 / 104-IA) TaxID=521098 RepID=C8WT72_ALIAD|nr:alpha/beta hydrolase [Alicyclobacillus acidocaldarius]ACV59586.1 peptidase S15 [Alicyclobacillus acidocaldarius subsp. acidocaldarius DSM 446]
MQRAVELEVDGLVLRGMEHVPDEAANRPVPAAILFHGFTGTHIEPHQLFVKLSRALEAEGVAAFRFDFAGSGDSDGEFQDMTASSEIRDAKAILDWVRRDPRIDPDRVSLIGLSMGGYVASIVAGDEPDKVDRLVLLAPAGNMADIAEKQAEALGAAADADVVDLGGNLVGRGLYEDLKQIDAFERAKPFRGKVLIIHGMEDQAVPYEVSLKYQNEVYGERARLHLIEEADHTFNNRHWESEVIRETVRFLTDVDRSQ